jgi:hypothetical protein
MSLTHVEDSHFCMIVASPGECRLEEIKLYVWPVWWNRSDAPYTNIRYDKRLNGWIEN